MLLSFDTDSGVTCLRDTCHAHVYVTHVTHKSWEDTAHDGGVSGNVRDETRAEIEIGNTLSNTR